MPISKNRLTTWSMSQAGSKELKCPSFPTFQKIPLITILLLVSDISVSHGITFLLVAVHHAHRSRVNIQSCSSPRNTTGSKVTLPQQ